MYPYDGGNKTNIFIKNELLYFPNTLYNVLLHEVLHSFGLGHSDKTGMMNYSIKLGLFNRIKEDSTKLWLSIDDIDGLDFLKNII